MRYARVCVCRLMPRKRRTGSCLLVTPLVLLLACAALAVLVCRQVPQRRSTKTPAPMLSPTSNTTGATDASPNDAAASNVTIEELARRSFVHSSNVVSGRYWSWFVDPATYMSIDHGKMLHSRFPRGAPVPTPVVVNPADFTARQRRVVRMTLNAWLAYRKHAWGHDELLPTARKGRDWDGNRVGTPMDVSVAIGVTLIESLDTLYLCGLHNEFDDALAYLATNHTFDVPAEVSLFETTIRVLGGLLSAYELSGRPVLLEKAYDLGKRLIGAFDVDGDHTPRVIPSASVNLRAALPSHPSWLGTKTSLAEVTSIQLEFRKLTYWTGYAVFDYLAQRVVMQVLKSFSEQPGGLYPLMLDRQTGSPIPGTITLGARGDSFFEYIAKQAALTAFRDPLYTEAWRRIVQGIDEFLVVDVNATHSFVVQAGFASGSYRRDYQMDHLACFLPGALVVGSTVHPLRASSVPERVITQGAVHQLAKRITRTCVDMYHTPSGLAPEITLFRSDTLEPLMSPTARQYQLRPETLEALYYQTMVSTGQEQQEWRRAVEGIVAAIEARCAVATGGYVGIADVLRTDGPRLEKMESYFVAETLKYAFLALEEGSPSLPLGQWVFNTEGHPLRVLAADIVHGAPP
jgi:hypothetical protein